MRYIINILLSLLVVTSCRNEEEIITSTQNQVTAPNTEVSQYLGLFLLNEGNDGSNKATLDHFEYHTGVYNKNIFAERNPTVTFELGDVGNDLQIYGDRLYAVINRSNLVEVMDLKTAEHLGVIYIPNPRYITFDGAFAYVSSYENYVAKIDIETLSIVAQCSVGYQPEQMAVVDDMLYVANSGGYVTGYDNRISVIDLDSFSLSHEIEVAVNLHRMVLDDYGYLWISSRGDYLDTSSKLYLLNTASDKVEGCFDLPVSNMTLAKDRLYILSTGFNNTTGQSEPEYLSIDIKSQSLIEGSFISDGTESEITLPYGIAVNSETEEIFVTDAKDYTIPGTLHCYSSGGVRQWSATTGDIPAHIAFTTEQLESIQ